VAAMRAAADMTQTWLACVAAHVSVHAGKLNRRTPGLTAVVRAATATAGPRAQRGRPTAMAAAAAAARRGRGAPRAPRRASAAATAGRRGALRGRRGRAGRRRRWSVGRRRSARQRRRLGLQRERARARAVEARHAARVRLAPVRCQLARAGECEQRILTARLCARVVL